MTKILSLLILLVSMNSYSQDSSKTYISFNTNIISNAGPIDENVSSAIEFGEQWKVFSLGIVTGQISKDFYNELRPNLNVFQQDKFVNTFTPGIGYIYNSNEPILIEFTTGIEYSWSDYYHININFGQYYFSGKNSSSSSVFFGASIVRFFKPFKSTGLIISKNNN